MTRKTIADRIQALQQASKLRQDAQAPTQAPLVSIPTDGNCRCGRAASKVHCPMCGRSSRIYSYASKIDEVTRADGTKVSLRVYRCCMCGHVFNDDAWMLDCRALLVQTGKDVLTSVMREASKLTAQERIQKEFGGDATAYRHSLFTREGVRQEKPLRPITGRLQTTTNEVASSPSTDEASMSQEESKAAAEATIQKLREMGIKI